MQGLHNFDLSQCGSLAPSPQGADQMPLYLRSESGWPQNSRAGSWRQRTRGDCIKWGAPMYNQGRLDELLPLADLTSGRLTNDDIWNIVCTVEVYSYSWLEFTLVVGPV